jgi:hypothetical protein
VTGTWGDKILMYTKWMIIIDMFIFGIPTSVLTIGSNTKNHPKPYTDGYNIIEKIQMSGYFVQELILSSIYIAETIRILRASTHHNTRKLMYQLMAVNILIIIMDLCMLSLECASLYILQTITKPTFYSIKLKLEFAILGKLVQFVSERRDSTVYYVDGKQDSSESQKRINTAIRADSDLSDFIDMTRVNSDMTGLGPQRKSSSAPHMDLDLEIARIEHFETLPSTTGGCNGDAISPSSFRAGEDVLRMDYSSG